MTADARVDAAIVETRRLDLLRRIADSGGRISPVADPQAKHGYQYAAPGGDVENDLAVLARRRFFENAVRRHRDVFASSKKTVE